MPAGGCAQCHAHFSQPIRIVFFAYPFVRAFYAGGTQPLCDRCILVFFRLSLSAVYPSVSCVGRLYLHAPVVTSCLRLQPRRTAISCARNQESRPEPVPGTRGTESYAPAVLAEHCRTALLPAFYRKPARGRAGRRRDVLM